MVKKITDIGFLLVRIIATMFAIVFFIYSLFTLWDMYRTEIKAFASYDLMKYRPNIEEEEPPYLDELLKINPDTAGWITIYGTNIDYPVLKGKDDNEYVNKGTTGEYNVAGSIFMSELNSKDFSDPYTLIYGHHMDNGSMFGDIDKFKDDEDFFYNNDNKRFKKEEGVLIKQNEVWNLKVFAVIDTSAYDNMIYKANKSQEDIPAVIEYAKNNAIFYRDVGEIDKILALSTCASATSYGRHILLCKMEFRTDPLPTREKEPLIPHREAVGHPMAGAYWALMNLVVLLAIIYFVLKINIRKDLFKKVKTKDKTTIKFLLIEGLLLLTSLIFFFLTEDLHKPIQIIDIWTIPMIVLFGLLYLTEKYKFKKLNKDGEENA